MAQVCKVCADSKLRGQIDLLISEGMSDENVSRAAASIGILISKSGVLRHRMNHQPADDLAEIELPAGMKLPLKLEGSTPMQNEATALLEAVRKIEGGVDVAKDQLTKETLLGQILETHLAITAVALDRYQKGEGRYPADMVKGLTAVGTLYEKTTLLLSSRGMTRAAIFEKEMQRREKDAREEARELALSGKTVEFFETRHSVSEGVRFGKEFVTPEDINERVETAWNQGVKQGKAERKLIRETPSKEESAA